MNMEDAVIPVSEILSTKSKFHLLLTYLTQKTGQIDYDDLTDEAIETFTNEYKNEKVVKQRIYQMLKEFKDDEIISIESYKGSRTIKLLIKAPYKIINIEKGFSTETMNIALIFSWVFFVISFIVVLVHTQIHVFWWIFFSFCNAFAITVIRVDWIRRFTLAKEQR